MKFYHSTKSEHAASIVNEQVINPSYYDLSAYLREVILSGWFDSDKFVDTNQLSIPQKFTDVEGNEQYVSWLGVGVYCFVETDLEQAQEYSANHDAIVEIIVDEKLCQGTNIFNMDSRPSRKKLKEFVVNGLKQLEDMQRPEDKEYVRKFREILEACLDNNFRGTPHAAGLLIDLYMMLVENFKIIKCTFTHGGGKKNKDPWFTQYVAIKDTEVIIELNQI
ncbi:hypothetical protein [Planococcus sp. ISL-110]|uniref:hypothetical protein n=1 Tax=Planococcus sp. ISL-110 TaxID=2819167 RepID=UPI001BE88BA8|nr:hypothetical protein [Planococcus sp. ISL-110]MBT2569837.1 hypothetical protein [Planococcus sp. ISL-110]